jgi:hypothetical protein
MIMAGGCDEDRKASLLRQSDNATTGSDRIANTGHSMHHSGAKTGEQSASIEHKGLMKKEEAGMANMQSGSTVEFLHCRKLG